MNGNKGCVSFQPSVIGRRDALRVQREVYKKMKTFHNGTVTRNEPGRSNVNAFHFNFTYIEALAAVTYSVCAGRAETWRTVAQCKHGGNFDDRTRQTGGSRWCFTPTITPQV
uniref:Uncharacterized protein n=1 Tax=Anopheles coluzzii TaxID=1518534 RepID=A0A8W7P848_ANOCL